MGHDWLMGHGARCVFVSAVLGACAGGNPRQGPGEPHALTTPRSTPTSRVGSPAPAASARIAAAPSVLHPVASVSLQVVPGNPRLLVGEAQVYEWRADGIVAKPRLLNEDLARARKLIEPLGDLRKEVVLAATWEEDKLFLVAPDQQAAFAATNTLKLEREPQCVTREFRTFASAD